MPSRATCGLKVAKLRDSSPSKWCELVFQFASIGRWQPPQLVVHDRWQVKQAMRSSPWARSVFATPGPQAKLPSSAPERDISLARAALALKCGRSEEHTSEPQSLMRNSYAAFCLNKKNKYNILNVNTLFLTKIDI